MPIKILLLSSAGYPKTVNRISDNALSHCGRLRKVMVVSFLFCFFNIFGQPMAEKHLPHHHESAVEECDNFIRIEGSTNVNHFHFEQIFKKKDEIIEEESQLGEIIKLKIPVREFTPSNPMMLDDFLKLIKASDYPFINITITFENIKLPAGPESTVIPKIKVGLAGSSQTYEIPGRIHDCRKESIHLNGKVSINLRDFDLEPPTKFMGMVKVNSEVFINFGLTLNK